MGSTRSVDNNPTFPPSSIPIPRSSTWMNKMGPNAVAGPSSEGALPRKPTGGTTPSPPKSPSSAPPTPSVIAVTHPSQFIHTHHPRRGSLTPLGLNLISPVPPHVNRDGNGSQPITSRSVGFQQPWPNAENAPFIAGGGSLLGQRRGSAASTTSTLTQSRPPQQPVHSFYPPDWNPGRRRSSLTPSGPTLAAPSPTRTHISGKSSRPVSSDGSNGSNSTPSVRSRHRALGTESIAPDSSTPSPFSGAPSDMYVRRGSLPHLGYGGWAGPGHRTWNPVLPPPRGSVGENGFEEVQLPNEGFKFGSVSGHASGSGSGGGSGTSPATAALRAVDLSPNSGRRASIRKRDEMDVFEQAEEAEAERQRRAFLAATYGDDGKRARERLSIGAQGGQGPPGTPAAAGGLRRQSLLLWERMGMAKQSSDSETAPSSAPPVPSSLFPSNGILGEGDLAQRRGSLPIAIPGGGLGRTPSRRSAMEHKKDSPSVGINTTTNMTTEEEDDDVDERMEEDEDEDELRDLSEEGQNSNGPLRPLPPLLPLSDPGPRLLPSTLALHRANHLLQSRNLQSDPLPHPLPPSLHPPAPVDVSEFDIDFILAGSQAQLGGQAKKKNTPVDILRTTSSPDYPHTPVLKLGGDDEDTFAKFVGEFDDEYGGRRGEWTFRACAAHHPGSLSPRDPLDTSSGQGPKAEWESTGAGKYELFPNGEVKSTVTGRSWRVYRLGNREYELEEVKSVSSLNSERSAAVSPAGSHLGGERYTLAGKNVHRDQGGVKLPHLNTSLLMRPQQPQSSATGRSNATLHSSSSYTSSPVTERKDRMDSEASTMTMTPALSQSTPLSTMAALVTKKKKHTAEEEQHQQQRGSVSSKEDKQKSKGLNRVRSKEGDYDAKKDKSLGGVFKRALKHSGLGGGSSSSDEKKVQREERERERAQANSWAGQSSHNPHNSWFSGSTKGPDGLPYKGQLHHQPPPENRSRMTSTSTQTASSHSATSSSDSGPWSSGEQPRKAASSTTSGEDVLMSETHLPKLREGKAWNGVPAEAVAMIIPLEEMSSTRPPLTNTQQPTSHPFFLEGSKQALLVWYVPFNAEHDEYDQQRPSTASSKASIPASDQPSSSSQSSAFTPGTTPGSAPVGSLPKFQKLLRRRASKENNSMKRDSNTPHGHAIAPQLGSSPITIKGQAMNASRMNGELSLPPLPFRSFRVVARVIDVQDLKSENESTPVSNQDQIANGVKTSPFDKNQNVFASSSSTALDPKVEDPINEISPFSDDAKTVQVSKTGKSMPTVIAVCHSRSQGVEFVLEGLDRLGLCIGESAWGPTGYEEWRGTGLSEKGRELLDILWAGCTGVMGLSAL
ncbi:hypothetical protein I302_104998 [Kwoniella bestiolae CBS 10118]|uniref:Uncharacterized protein n=1 Tax=Kwoniella bestiolae CBS 10118 TaxID=1296100 RepID=A0A1B9FR61_9TREE|nr:hypothetical protein I302_08930 [Kwoniella bestiolae CBS 10118]OCF21258.1 hypothetical protein I302_08930 [Kwoniella bestiolae CBS 10118]